MEKPAIVFALYRPHPGREAELLQAVSKHCPTLRRCGLVTDRAPIICRAADGTIVEVFEWVSDTAHKRAHEHPEIADIWEWMGRIADMPGLDSLEEAKLSFPHFEPVVV